MKPVVAIPDAVAWLPEEGRVSCAEEGWWTAAVDRPSPGYTGRVKCPYGVPGDRLWVREDWKTSHVLDDRSPAQMVSECRESGWKKAWTAIEYLADGRRENWDAFPMPLGRYRNSRFMPRDFSRITLEITDVRVQRVQDISEEDAMAEGVEKLGEFPNITPWRNYTVKQPAGAHNFSTSRASFMSLWSSIDSPESYSANPWVWAINFRQVTA